MLFFGKDSVNTGFAGEITDARLYEGKSYMQTN